jgi:uncharacterized protein YegP (UPF0339 family)
MTNDVRLIRRLLACCVLPGLALILWAGTAAAQKEKPGQLTFEVYKDRAGEYRWRLKSANSKILAVPEDGYKNHSGVKSAIESIQKNIGKMKVEYYEDRAKEHRWRLKATNGQVMARSSEGYKHKEGAEKAVEIIRHGVKDARVIDKK